jgi:hypothetical protein
VTRWLIVALAGAVGLALVPATATSRSSRVTSSGTWAWASADHTIAAIKLALTNGACQLVVAPEASGESIEAVIGSNVSDSPATPTPHPFVGLNVNPPVTAGGTLQFSIQTSPALPANTVISVQIYPTCNSGAGLEQVNATQAPTTLPPKETPHLDKAIDDLHLAITLEQKAENDVFEKPRRLRYRTELHDAVEALIAARAQLDQAIHDHEASADAQDITVARGSLGYALGFDREINPRTQSAKAMRASFTRAANYKKSARLALEYLQRHPPKG